MLHVTAEALQEEITDDGRGRRLHDPDVHRYAKGDKDADPT
jgi:hypothetical protein